MIKSSVEANYYNTALVSEEIVDRYWELLRLPGNRVAAADRVKVNRNPDYWENISDINVPVLVLRGEGNSVTPFTLAEKYQDKIEDCEIITYSNAGHLRMEEIAIVVAKDISEWANASY